MKSKTIALISAAIITAAAFILTAGLSLLNISAIEESLIPSETLVPDASAAISETVDNEPGIADENFVIDEIFVEPENTVEDEPVVEDEPIIENEPVIEDEEDDEPLFYYDVVIAIYEHATGKQVGQLTFTDDEYWYTVEALHREVYTLGECIYDPQDDESEMVCIPESKYRVEVFAIWYAGEDGSGELPFAYSYGVENNELIEMWGNGVLYSGGYNFIAYIDSLIADEIEKIEAGSATVPSPEEEIARVIGFYGSVWTGDFYGAYEREAPRFPYLKD